MRGAPVCFLAVLAEEGVPVWIVWLFTVGRGVLGARDTVRVLRGVIVT